MPPATRIEDAGDERLADYVALTDRQRRRGFEDSHGILVVEGAFAVGRLLESPYPVRSLVLTPARAAALPDLVGELARRGRPVYVAEREVLEQVAGFDVHRGVLASAGRLPLPPVDALSSSCRRLLVLEGVSDSENVGAAFRNAAAFGIGAVLLDWASADPLYRRSVRVSVGHSLLVPFTRSVHLPADLDRLRRQGFTVVALTPGGGTRVTELHRLVRDPVVLLAGAEGPGLSAGALACADVRCRIDLSPTVDSLNVATAVAIAAHELARR